ncbi:MAG: hypothetical protein KKE11_05675, partial [Gammaproteobacteria bacterium]|nr:hypothetical protein [Gammaproteobacteria bacterium]
GSSPSRGANLLLQSSCHNFTHISFRVFQVIVIIVELAKIRFFVMLAKVIFFVVPAIAGCKDHRIRCALKASLLTGARIST